MEKNINDRKLRAMTVWFDTYVNMLDEVVDENGDIYLREYSDKYYEIYIDKNRLNCWVKRDLWYNFSYVFSLQDNDVESFIMKWVENTYQLKGIHTDLVFLTDSLDR